MDGTQTSPQTPLQPINNDLPRRLGVLGFLVLAIAALFWAGVHNLRARRATLEANRVELTPASPGVGADTAAPDAEGANLIGHSAPQFTLTDTDGHKVSLADFKGHPVMLNFWATWCGPCKLEMPWIQEFSAKYKSQGLVILGMDQDTDTARTTIAETAKKIGVSYPILLPDEKVANAYGGVEYLPETFYVDKAGKILRVGAGVPSKDQMEALIQQTIAAQGS